MIHETKLNTDKWAVHLYSLKLQEIDSNNCSFDAICTPGGHSILFFSLRNNLSLEGDHANTVNH